MISIHPLLLFALCFNVFAVGCILGASIVQKRVNALKKLLTELTGIK